MNKIKNSFCYILPNIIMYKNENGRYILKEIEAKQGMVKSWLDIELDIPEKSGKWRVVREYEGSFSAEEIVGQIIKVHMGGRMDV